MSRRPSDFVEQIVQELKRCKGALTAGEAARLVRRSESHFRHAFRGSVGITFRRFRLRARIELARDLLRQTEMDISSISEKLGYSDRSAFERAFRRLVGVTPTEYRRQQ